MDWIDLIKWIAGIIFGGGFVTVVGWFVFFKQNKRLKNAEAEAKELENMNVKIAMLENMMASQVKRMDTLQQDVATYYERNRALQNELSLSELKRQKNKNCIAQAESCNHIADPSECPVIIQRKKHEAEYLKMLEDGNKRQRLNNNINE